MSKSAVFVALLCTSSFLGECTLEKPNLSRHMTIIMPKSTTITMGGQLYTVSIDKSIVHVNSSDASHKACDMTIDPVKHSIQGEMKVDASDKMMYILGEHSVERVYGKDRTKYTLLMIDPRDCSLNVADIPDINVGMKPALPRMLLNSAGVDVYFPSMQTCAPCRFDDQGVKVKDSPAQIAAPTARNDGRVFSFDIRQIGDNYIYAQNMGYRMATIKIFDGKTMNVIKEKQVDYPVDAMANTKAGIMGICSKTQNYMMIDIVAYKEIICEKMNSNLDTSDKIQIAMGPYAPGGPNSRPVSRISYEIDDTGNKTYIGFAEDRDLRVYVYDSSGQLLKSYDLGEIDVRFVKYQLQTMFDMPYTHWNVRGFIMGKEYCLVTEQVSDTDNHQIDLHDVRCINI